MRDFVTSSASPPHYQGKIQPIDLIESACLNFNEGNIIKYVCRSRRKGERIRDLEKAMWYLKREYEAAMREEHAGEINKPLFQLSSAVEQRPVKATVPGSNPGVGEQ